MLTFTLAIFCLTTTNLPWFMDLTFQVPMQYCSLHHWILLLSPGTCTAGYCFCFGSIPSFFAELFLHWSPVASWAPNDWGVPLLVSSHFAFSCCSWGSQGKNTEVACQSLLQWTTFCQMRMVLFVIFLPSITICKTSCTFQLKNALSVLKTIMVIKNKPPPLPTKSPGKSS